MRVEVKDVVSQVISVLNEELQYDFLKEVTDNTPIFGEDEGIDSLSLAFMISEIELSLGEKYDKHIVLADEKAMSIRNSPYRTVGTLVEFILNRLENDDE